MAKLKSKARVQLHTRHNGALTVPIPTPIKMTGSQQQIQDFPGGGGGAQHTI